jgi:hypothetical protein
MVATVLTREGEVGGEGVFDSSPLWLTDIAPLDELLLRNVLIFSSRGAGVESIVTEVSKSLS